MDWVWIRPTSPPDVVVHISWTVAQGPQGIQGIQGLSTYQLAVQEGYSGTQSQWLSEQEASRLDALNSKKMLQQQRRLRLVHRLLLPLVLQQLLPQKQHLPVFQKQMHIQVKLMLPLH
ncbi:hypothetical protein ACFFJX_12655 [Pseudarcicella hirudinis]|uniref:hypothetical protein n=1 Tax=Pseudarcicella hirudinis TaxID=1079859 RepID=UPI0035ECD6EF